jgi:competence protein ComEC
MALEIFIPNTGQGDCTFVKFPNGKNMLIDFNRTDVDVDIIELLRVKIPKRRHEDLGRTCRRINYFINTHPHEDHIRGIEALNDEEFYIDEIWESNHRLFVPESDKDKYKHYYDFLKLVNKLKRRDSVKILKAGRTPRYIGSTKWYTFAPSGYYQQSDSPTYTEIHNQCGIIKLEYAGNSILFAGDSNRASWEDRIVPHYSDDKIQDGKKLENLLEATVLHASHHGSKYFFVAENDDDDRYKRGIDKINPSFTIISVGEKNNHGHPHRIAMNIYREKTKYKRVFTTKDDKSIYFAFKNDGSVEYKKGLTFEELKEIRCSAEKDMIHGVSSMLSFNLGKEIELELPRRPPKPKREGYR